MKWTYQGKFVKVAEDRIDDIVWEKVYLRGGVAIFPITKDGNVLLIKEKRPHENPNHRIKAVTGHYEEEYDFEENVQRELQEEIGFRATTITLLNEMKVSGTVNNYLKFALAEGLVPSKIPNPDGEDSIMEIIEVSLDEMKKMIFNDEIPWSLSTLGMFRLLNHYGKI